MFKRFALLGLLMLAFTACPQVSSLDSTTVEQLTPSSVRVTTKLSGLLTIYSTAVITGYKGKDVSMCVLSSALGRVDQGLICKNVPAKFIVDLETTGKINARVTN